MAAVGSCQSVGIDLEEEEEEREREREREDTHVELPDGVRKYSRTEYGEGGVIHNRGFLF